MCAAGAEEVVQESAMRILSAPRGWAAIRADLGRRQVRPHARHREPLRLRWQHLPDARVGQSGLDDSGARGANRRLFDLAGRQDLHFRCKRHDAAADTL